MKPATTIFLALLTVTIAVWVMRGIGILSFIPGILIWLLFLATIGAGVVSTVQRTIR